MIHTKNKLRQIINMGQPVIGTVCYAWSPNIMEVAGLAGMDFVRIDTEHAWRRDETVEHLIRAAYLADTVPLMRVDREDPYLIRKALEIGAGAIVVPDVQDAKETENIIKAAKFPPKGTRGYSAQCWSGGWGSKGGADWIHWSDSEPMIGVMVENTKATDNIESIMAVEGLDYVLFGPADYSMSLDLGKPQKNHVQVMEGLQKTIEAAQKNNKPVMLGVGTNLEDIRKYKEMGISMFELGSDIAILGSVWGKIKDDIGKMQ